MNRIRKSWLTPTIGVMLALTSTYVRAAEVRVGLSARESYVGVPLTLQVRVSNAEDSKPPQVPDVDGLQIRAIGMPGRSTQITTINGRTTTNTSLTYNFEVTPQRAGTFRIPPITVHADGTDQQTPVLELVATKSETGDVLFVEVAGKQKEIYVGQSLDLSLKVWLRPFRDREHGITLSEGDMWRMISDRSSWGPFSDRMQQLSEKDQRPVGKEVLRKDASGEEHSYYLYEVDATIYPKRPGKIDANDVKVIVQYPTAIGKSRDPFAGIFDDLRSGRPSAPDNDFFNNPFGSRLEVQAVRPIVGETHVEPVQVMPIPTAGRPADYRGAVGKYVIALEASPTSVKAGDPINVLIGISGTGPMELVQAPPLSELSELTADFKVPTEPLAGFVKDNRKVFSTSIRPRKAGIAHIPSIPFSYFDPDAKRFVTVNSDPIAIQVEPAETLSLDTITKQTGRSSDTHIEKQSAASIPASNSFANYSDENVLESEQPFKWNSPTQLFLILVPAFVVVGAAAFRFRGFLSPATMFWRTASQRCRQAIHDAKAASDVAAAVQEFLAREFKVRGVAQETELLGLLRSAGHRSLAIRGERVFDDCRAVSTLGRLVAPRALPEIKQDAVKFVDDLAMEMRTRRVRPLPSMRGTKKSARNHATGLLLAMLALIACQRNMAFAMELDTAKSYELSREQQVLLLSEANAAYDEGTKLETKDAATAKQNFEAAAEKYQLIVSSGVKNSRLFANLGNAYFKAGQLGKAIANYRRSLQLDPTNRVSRENLQLAEEVLNSRTNASQSDASATGSSNMLAKVAHWLRSYLGPRVVFAVGIFAWIALCGVIAARLFTSRIPGKPLAAGAMMLVIAATGFFFGTSRVDAKHLAVVVAPNTTAYEADGRNFPVAGMRLREGELVEQLKARNDWVQIRNAAGQTGWIARSDAEPI